MFGDLLRSSNKRRLIGTFNALFDLNQGTIFGPFGGPAMGGPGLSEGQAAIASLFHDGAVNLEVVDTLVCGDVVCLVMVAHNTVRFEGQTEARRWVLRSTMLFRQDGDAWIFLHRHADPLIDRRDLASMLALLAIES